jgi:hypothetical protein
MRLRSRRHAMLAFGLLIACVIGCKSGNQTSSSSSSNSTSTPDANRNSNDSGSSSGNSSGNSNPAPAPDIAGQYGVTGTNVNGTAYKGDLEVIKHGDVYQFRWSGGPSYDGVGVQLGEVVAVAFTTGTNGKGCGVVDYTIIDDGARLDGKWGYWGTDAAGTEKATRTLGSGLIGTFDGTGTNPDGRQYKVQIVVVPAGSGYTFAWSNNSEGFGIRRGDNIAVGIGGARCGFVSYQVKSDGTLDGVWGGYGSEKTGTEKAMKK